MLASDLFRQSFLLDPTEKREGGTEARAYCHPLPFTSGALELNCKVVHPGHGREEGIGWVTSDSTISAHPLVPMLIAFLTADFLRRTRSHPVRHPPLSLALQPFSPLAFPCCLHPFYSIGRCCYLKSHGAARPATHGGRRRSAQALEQANRRRNGFSRHAMSLELTCN
jgi:hypothetical protein